MEVWGCLLLRNHSPHYHWWVTLFILLELHWDYVSVQVQVMIKNKALWGYLHRHECDSFLFINSSPSVWFSWHIQEFICANLRNSHVWHSWPSPVWQWELIISVTSHCPCITLSISSSSIFM
jgi:hypothetical protein